MFPLVDIRFDLLHHHHLHLFLPLSLVIQNSALLYCRFVCSFYPATSKHQLLIARRHPIITAIEASSYIIISIAYWTCHLLLFPYHFIIGISIHRCSSISLSTIDPLLIYQIPSPLSTSHLKLTCRCHPLPSIHRHLT